MTTPIVRRSPTHRATVLGAVDLTPRMRRVTVASDAMRDVQLRPAQDVELHLRTDEGRRVKRRYTIAQARPQAGELDLDVLLHGDGPGARWGAVAGPGDEVEFQGPRGKLELRSAPWHLLAGDESALPAIAAILAALPPGEPAQAFVEVTDTDDELPGLPVTWVHRGDAAPGGPDVLDAALATFPLPPGAGHAYLMGETRAVVALRGALERRGVAHESVFVKGYWNLGRPDRLANRPPT
ncbi:siderophore-interacting protein [uncultured Jatrophihabitans sp.]|uniref:siderophore-interacting protein n=1 Tax=uncultured Jatrophihabitans sp. TaxID=1610747 RepID=UPI0035CB60C4